MRLFKVLAATIVLACMSVAAQGSALYVKRTEVNVLITNGGGQHEQLALGYNILGEQHPIGCIRTEGCLVTIASMVGVKNVTGSWSICTLVDGEPTSPPCEPRAAPTGPLGDVGNGLASVVISKGHHTIETGVVLNDSGGAQLDNWEVHYTLFLDPPHGHDGGGEGISK